MPPDMASVRPSLGDSTAHEGMALLDWLPEAELIQREPTYDQVFHIASWTFLLVSAAIAALSGMWGARLPQIVTLVAVTGGFLVLTHDVLPSGALRFVRAVVQASVALAFASLLVVLTNGFESPFFFTFTLIVGGAALVVSPAL